MHYQEFAPAPSLRGLVSSYWHFSLSAAHVPPVIDHAVPPDGTVNLCWLPSEEAVILGPRVTALHVPVHAGAEFVGIRFVPGAAGPLLNLDVRALRDRVTPLERADFADAARAMGVAGFDALISTWCVAAQAKPDPLVADVAARIADEAGAVTIAALAVRSKVSYRQLLRRFRDATGLTPKEFARIRRIRAACVEALAARDPDWADVSAGSGFSDQSHLTREFRDVFGWPPRLVHEYLRRIEHRDVTS